MKAPISQALRKPERVGVEVAAAGIGADTVWAMNSGLLLL
jgi:hypothetical protein